MSLIVVQIKTREELYRVIDMSISMGRVVILVPPASICLVLDDKTEATTMLMGMAHAQAEALSRPINVALGKDERGGSCIGYDFEHPPVMASMYGVSEEEFQSIADQDPDAVRPGRTLQ